MEEIWKDVKGYEGLYQVSNSGRVKSFWKSWVSRGENEHIMHPSNTRGYYYVKLRGRDGKDESFPVHRLVAIAFIPNPTGLRCVNHKDENKKNNMVENLEWCTPEYNFAYGTARLRQGISYGKPVQQLTADKIWIASYTSAETAGYINGIDPSSIHKCCKGKRKTAGKYVWRYSDSDVFSQ